MAYGTYLKTTNGSTSIENLNSAALIGVVTVTPPDQTSTYNGYIYFPSYDSNGGPFFICNNDTQSLDPQLVWDNSAKRLYYYWTETVGLSSTVANSLNFNIMFMRTT